MNEEKIPNQKSKTICQLRTISAIEIMVVTGKGTENDPERVVIQYWDMDGHLLAVNDPIIEFNS